MPATAIRIGTRDSPLALAQAEETRRRLAEAHDLPPDAVAVVPIRTTGDRILDRPLSEAGGKGLFTKEIDDALLDGRIDLAVHSAKDMPTLLPKGLSIVASLPRVDVRDAFISAKATRLSDLAEGAIVGTSSLRRKAFALRHRPDLRVVDFRGNVQTRLRKIESGEADATFLALAGLTRLGIADRATSFVDTEGWLPAVGQGIIAIVARSDDEATRARLAALDHRDTSIALAAERAFLTVLDGSCRTPIGGLAELGPTLRLRGVIVKTDGSVAHEINREGPAADAERIGAEAGRELLERAGPGFF